LIDRVLRKKRFFLVLLFSFLTSDINVSRKMSRTNTKAKSEILSKWSFFKKETLGYINYPLIDFSKGPVVKGKRKVQPRRGNKPVVMMKHNSSFQIKLKIKGLEIRKSSKILKMIQKKVM